MRLYFDACCISRLTDDQSQPRVLREAEAADAETILAFIHEFVKLDDKTVERSLYLRGKGFSELDALHLACAESAQVDVFLTTDDRLIRRANRLRTVLAVRVLNPLSFLEEVRDADSGNV